MCPGYVDDSAWFPFGNAVTVERLEVAERREHPNILPFFCNSCRGNGPENVTLKHLVYCKAHKKLTTSFIKLKISEKQGVCTRKVGNTVLIVPSEIHNLYGTDQDSESENSCWEHYGLLWLFLHTSEVEGFEVYLSR